MAEFAGVEFTYGVTDWAEGGKAVVKTEHAESGSVSARTIY